MQHTVEMCKLENWVTVKLQYRSQITVWFTFLCGLENTENQTERDPPDLS